MTKLAIILWTLLAIYLVICYGAYLDAKLTSFDQRYKDNLEAQAVMREWNQDPRIN
jgi:hypothetical protein